MPKVRFIDGLSADIDLPSSWEDRSLVSFAGPLPPSMLRARKMVSLRSSLTVSAVRAQPGETLDRIRTQTWNPDGVAILQDQIQPEERRYLRVLRFTDRETGSVIQQEFQIYVHGDRVYTAVISCDPFSYSRDARAVSITVPKAGR